MSNEQDQTPGPHSPASALRRAQWRMVGAVMLCYLFYYTGRHNFAWAGPGIIEEFGITKEKLGWASAGMLWAYGLGQLINGNLADRYGARVMMALGAVLSVAMNWATSFAPTFAALVVLWSLNGYCQSLGWAPGSRLLSNWWPTRERGKAFGFYTFAAACSSILIFYLAIIILRQEWDWRWLMRLPVLLLLLAAIAFYFIARERPEDMGFKPIETDGVQPAHGRGLAENTRSRYRHVFGNRRFMIACIAIGFENVARYGLLVWTPIHYLGAGWKDDPNTWTILGLPAGMALGAVFFGQLSDRVFRSNRSRPIAISMGLAGIVAALIWAVPEPSFGVALILMVLAGFLVYGPQALFWPLSPDLLGTQRAGTGVGVMNSCAYLFAGLGEPFIGRMIDSTGDTSVVFILTAIFCWASAAIVLFVRR